MDKKKQSELEIKLAEAQAREKECRNHAYSVNKGGFIAMMIIGLIVTVIAIVLLTTSNGNSGEIIAGEIFSILGSPLFGVGLVFTIINASRQHASLSNAEEARRQVVLYQTLLDADSKEKED